MKSSYSNIMQSKYFNVAFNSAIFDGPLRIYFAQFHESYALKIYFNLQQKFKDELLKMKEISKTSHSNIYIMIYPSDEQYELSFDSSENKMIQSEVWDQDMVMGIQKPSEEILFDAIDESFKRAVSAWILINSSAISQRQLDLV